MLRANRSYFHPLIPNPNRYNPEMLPSRSPAACKAFARMEARLEVASKKADLESLILRDEEGEKHELHETHKLPRIIRAVRGSSCPCWSE